MKTWFVICLLSTSAVQAINYCAPFKRLNTKGAKTINPYRTDEGVLHSKKIVPLNKDVDEFLSTLNNGESICLEGTIIYEYKSQAILAFGAYKNE
ncbi:MAG: hypothetical protein H6622_07570 [Halobacteriovoraceae bacterium]|nr:hypothetical protein [Halobacteriovoraceae bacterium]